MLNVMPFDHDLSVVHCRCLAAEANKCNRLGVEQFIKGPQFEQIINSQFASNTERRLYTKKNFQFACTWDLLAFLHEEQYGYR